MKRTRRFAFPSPHFVGTLCVAGFAVIVVAGCSGGSSSSPIPSTATPAPIATPAIIASTSFTIPTSVMAVPLPAFSGAQATLGFGAGAPANDQMTIVQSLPANATASKVRRTRAIPTGDTEILDFTINVTAATPLSALSSLTLGFDGAGGTIGNVPFSATSQYFLEIDDTTSGLTIGSLGPATPASLLVQYLMTPALGATVLQPTDTYVFRAFVQPTASPTPTPVPAVSANPSSLSLIGGVGTVAQTILTQSGNTGAVFTETDTCSAFATVQITSGTLAVTSTNAGSCTITVTGIGGATLTIPVSITIVTGVLQ
jgi:hypothetical protein